MERLPEQYRENMKELLGAEYSEYINSFSEKSYTAFRMNTSKISLKEWQEINPFSTSEIAWIEKGFYYDSEKDNPSKHPYYYAGLYYIQEPSAMIPASLLPVEKGDKVLDLCAAPGGKATELGARLDGTGLLVANDISVSRTMALAKNLQMAGITNAVVTAETPEKLCYAFAEYFDKILIDAPCSGEGMFRREPRMIKDWLEKGPEYYSKVQKEILAQAYAMLKPGGMLVYSTCTFSILEDEGVVQWLLMQHPDMEICPVSRKEGFSDGRPDLLENGLPELKHCVRIFPHRAKGEGHFAVLLRKRKAVENDTSVQSISVLKESGENTVLRPVKTKKRKSDKKKRDLAEEEKAQKEMAEFIEKLPLSAGNLFVTGNGISKLPIPAEELKGIRTIYQGMPLCEWKHKVLPSHQLALTMKAKDFSQVLDLQADDERVIRYLKGETISIEEMYQGNVLVCVNGFGLGWGQGNAHGILKNKYYPGWRYQ